MIPGSGRRTARVAVSAGDGEYSPVAIAPMNHTKNTVVATTINAPIVIQKTLMNCASLWSAPEAYSSAARSTKPNVPTRLRHSASVTT